MVDLAKQWLSLVAVAISLAGVIYSWFTAKSKVNAEHLKIVDTKLDDHKSRIEKVETELSHMPAKDDVTELKLAISKLEGAFGRLDENLSSVSRTVHRVDDYLRKRGQG